ncbi:MAG: ATP-dependent helicase HrpB [Nitriliruptoraceae bacterium]
MVDDEAFPPAARHPAAAALPVDAVLGELVAALDHHGRVVLEAPPGAGKTTRVPLALLQRARPGGIVLLEPRRVAARAAAMRLAAQLGEEVGQRVGLTTRDERRRSADTRIEVVTEGVLLRRLQRDPSLAGTSLLFFDEFHERNLEADLALAFALESRAALRDDLEILIASATLDGARVARLLGQPPVIRAEGRTFQVDIEHHDRPARGQLVAGVRTAVLELLASDEGDLLVFLPGAREIHRTEAALIEAGLPAEVVIRPLHGSLPPAEQDAALSPSPSGERKVVLATDLAESSVTIEGVTAVIDAGLAREPRFDAATGLSGLVTVPASQAAAAQRAGRAGRTAPGRCIRLWPAREHAARDRHPRPAIVTDDLTGTALEVATWGAEVAELPLLDQPPAAAWARALETLSELGAIEPDGRPSAHGRRLAELPLHPRLAHLLVTAQVAGHATLGAEIAALLADRDVLLTGRERPDADLASRLTVLRGGPVPGAAQVRRGALARARRERDRLLRLVGERRSRDDPTSAIGALVLSGWPDQLAVARPERRGGYLLAGGRGAELPEGDPLAGEPWLAVAHLDRGAQVARIHLAAAVEEDAFRRVLGDRIEVQEEVAWRDGDVVSERREQLGAIVLTRQPLEGPNPDRLLAALLTGLRAEGLDVLDVRAEDRQLQARVALVREHLGSEWPSIDDQTLLAAAEERLAPFLLRVRSRAGLARVRLRPILEATLGHHRLRELDRLAPSHLSVASGSRRQVDYNADAGPTLAVRLQELFGTTTTPTLVAGRVRVVLHLLSPAGRPVQVTDDLAGFWERVYPEVRSELRGRYPKHAWPADPRTAEPLRGTPRRRRR